MRVKAWHSALRESGGATGRPLSASSVQLARRVLHRALADAVRWNVLVHNAASAARASGAEPKVVQEQLGHAGIDITLDIYSHVPQAVRRKAADRIADLLSTPPSS